MVDLVFNVEMVKVLIKVRYMFMQLSFEIRVIIALYQNSDVESVFHLEIPRSTKKVNILLWLEVLLVFFPPDLILK